jgi:hypothetical protein
VLWLAGDFHLGSAQRVSESGAGMGQLEILAGPGAQLPNLGVALLGPPRFDFATGTNNYVALHLDPASTSARVVFHDGNDAVLFDRTYAL